MLIKDNNEIADIRMIGKNGIDWEEDFFNSGTLEKDTDGAYIVDSIKDCIDAAVDYCLHEGDYADITDSETELYINNELESQAGKVPLVIEEKYSCEKLIQSEETRCRTLSEAVEKTKRYWSMLAPADKRDHKILAVLATPDTLEYDRIWSEYPEVEDEE